MTNKKVSAIFTDAYNGFFIKHRDNLPAISDEAGWDAIVDEGKALMAKHDCQLARDMVAGLIEIMDRRQRDKERENHGD